MRNYGTATSARVSEISKRVVSTPSYSGTLFGTKRICKNGLWFEGNLESEQIIAGAWRFRDEDKTVIIAVNISDETAPFTLSFDITEYGIAHKHLPECFTVDGNRCTITDTLEPDGIRVLRI